MTVKSLTHPYSKYRCQSGVSWGVELRNTIIIDGNSGRVWTLEYPEAAIWDLLTRGCRIDRIIAMISAIADVEEPSAAKCVHSAIIKWTYAGLQIRT